MLRYPLILLLLCGLWVGRNAWSKFKIYQTGTRVPQPTAATELGKTQNRHVQLTHFQLGPTYFSQVQNGSLYRVFIPIQEEGNEMDGPILGFISAFFLKDESEIQAIYLKRPIEAVIMNDIERIMPDTQAQLESFYDLEKGSQLPILDMQYHFPQLSEIIRNALVALFMILAVVSVFRYRYVR